MTLDRIILPLLVASLVALGAIELCLYFRFVSGLKRKYPSVWQDLGQPPTFFPGSIQQTSAVRRFLRNKEYLKLNDPSVEERGRRLGIWGRFYLGFFLIVVFAFLVLILQGWRR